MRVRILSGDVFEMLATLPENHFDCVVTSPPYWGLRDYGVAGQIGLEPTLAEHLDIMVRVFRDVRRVMKPEATLWLNYGDCYATTPNGRSAAATKAAGNDDRTFRDKPFSTIGPIYDPEGGQKGGGARGENKGNSGGQANGRVVAGGYLKPKDLCMIPNRLAIALQDDGWWVRSEIVWGKTNPMPDSSGRYRPSTAHEKIFLLTKSAKSFYDCEAVRVERAGDEDSNEFPGSVSENGSPAPRVRTVKGNQRVKMPDNWDTGPGGHGSRHRNGREKGQYVDKQRGHTRRHAGFNDRWDKMEREEQIANGRFLRNYEPAPLEVWRMATAPFPGAHFATFPPELVERALTAGCPAGGCVLDPFGGAGTVGLVADRLGVDCTLIELNQEYVEITRARIHDDAGLFGEIEVDGQTPLRRPILPPDPPAPGAAQPVHLPEALATGGSAVEMAAVRDPATSEETPR